MLISETLQKCVQCDDDQWRYLSLRPSDDMASAHSDMTWQLTYDDMATEMSKIYVDSDQIFNKSTINVMFGYYYL